MARKLIIVVLLLIVVGGYALYVEHQTVPSATPPLYAGLKKGDIAKMELRYPDRELDFARGEDGTWKILAPVQTDGDQQAINAIADAIVTCQIVGTAADHAANLADFGLERPVVAITVVTRDGRTLTPALVGKDTPVGANSYIKMADQPAILEVASVFSGEVNKSLGDLRSHTLLHFKLGDVQAMRIEHNNGAPPIAVERQGSNWFITEPARYPTQQENVEGVLNSMIDAQADNFIEDHPKDLARYGLVQPAVKITAFVGTDRKPESLEVGFKENNASTDAYYVRRGGGDFPICTVATPMVEGLDRSLLDLRTLRFFLFDPSKVQSVSVAAPNMNYTLRKAADGKWQISSGAKMAEAEAPVADSLVDQLSKLKAVRILEDPTSNAKLYGLDAPTMTIALVDADGKAIGSAKFAQSSYSVKSPADVNASTNDYVGVGSATMAIDTAAFRDLRTTINRLDGDIEPNATADVAPSTSVTVVATPEPSPPTAP